MEAADSCEFDKGKIVNGKWLVDSRIGEGCCGIVFKVRDVRDRRRKAAMKVEPKDEEIQVLKNEARVLKLLMERRNVVKVLDSGKRRNYSYLVMSLLGDSIAKLCRDRPTGKFSAGTTTRVGIQALYAIKQLHEVGYVHRDIKPSNLVIGRRGKEGRMIYLIDYGLARSFVVWSSGGNRIREPRTHALLRGTTRYCSPGVHDRQEQGRKDDVWSMVYLMVELHVGLPWVHKPEAETKKMKMETPDAVLMDKCPPEWIKLMHHVRQLSYGSRPDYRLLYDILIEAMGRLKVTFADLYDWETVCPKTGLPIVQQKVTTSTRSKETTEETKSQEACGNNSADDVVYPNTVPAEFDKNDLHL